MQKEVITTMVTSFIVQLFLNHSAKQLSKKNNPFRIITGGRITAASRIT